MIAPNTRNRIRKRLAVQHNKTMMVAQQNAQRTLNAVLWQIITKNTKRVDPDAFADGESPPAAAITMAFEDLKDIPAGFGLTLQKNDDETLSVIAIVTKPKSNIILPDGNPADG